MGGKKGAVLGSWIKEICTLVFIQTIQAFIYAFIISLIVSMAFLEIQDVDDRNSSMGIISVIGLVSVFKIEEMIKKIFGVGNSKADVKGAMSSLAKTAIAWQFGKRVLDNGTKMLGGVKGIRDASKGRQKLKQRMDRDLGTFDEAGDGGTAAIGDGQEPYREYYDKAKQAKAAGDMDGYRTNMGIAAGLKKAGATATTSGSSSKSGKNVRDYNAMLDKYQDQLSELKKKRSDSIKQIWQGVGETAGAIPGLAAGAIIGGADGNLDEALRGAAVGMGVGDTIGGGVVKSAYNARDIGKFMGETLEDPIEATAKITDALRKNQIEGKGLEKAKNAATAWHKEATKNRVSERELQDIIKKANEAHADNAN